MRRIVVGDVSLNLSSPVAHPRGSHCARRGLALSGSRMRPNANIRRLCSGGIGNRMKLDPDSAAKIDSVEKRGVTPIMEIFIHRLPGPGHRAIIIDQENSTAVCKTWV